MRITNNNNKNNEKENDLTIFTNDKFGEIRSILINGEPYFVGKDIAVALGYNAVAKGALGNWIVLAEWACDGLNDGCTIKDVQSSIVGSNNA